MQAKVTPAANAGPFHLPEGNSNSLKQMKGKTSIFPSKPTHSTLKKIHPEKIPILKTH